MLRHFAPCEVMLPDHFLKEWLTELAGESDVDVEENLPHGRATTVAAEILSRSLSGLVVCDLCGAQGPPPGAAAAHRPSPAPETP